MSPKATAMPTELSSAQRARQRWLSLQRDNRHLLGKLTVIAALMFGFGYALVPMYRTICEALGVNVLSRGDGRLAKASSDRGNTQVDLSRTITVEFDANSRGPWDFKPAVQSLQVHPGELTTVMYRFRNVQNRTMSAQAIPSYAPKQATAHFNKVECFCFQQYTLAPGESREWPVAFVIDPKLPREVSTITLSYTFFEVGGRPVQPRGAQVGVVTPPPVLALQPAPLPARGS
jgi:cytochrome c oxidase assembly protein subunit 11